MKKPNLSKVKLAVRRAEHKQRAVYREGYARYSDEPRLEHVNKDRSLQSAIEMDLKDPRIALPQTNCLWHPSRRTFKSIK